MPLQAITYKNVIELPACNVQIEFYFYNVSEAEKIN